VLFSLIPLLSVTVLAGGILEVVLRFRYHDIVRITGAAEWEVAEFGGFTYGWDRYHPMLGWTNVPGYRSDAGVPFEVTINSQGLRGSREFAPTPDPAVTRIALFGDSLAFGEEVDDDATIAAHLERGRRDVEVLNFGVHGYGLGQAVLRLEIDGARFVCDHVVLAVLFPEDLIRDEAGRFVHAKPVFRLDGDLVVVENTPVPEASRMPLVMRHSYAAAWLFGRRGVWHRTHAGGGPNLELGKALIRRAAAVCSARGSTLSVVLMLAPAGVQRHLSDPVWRRQFDDERARFSSVEEDVLDLVPIQLRAFRDERMVLVAPLAHWSSRGNELWAEAIAEHLGLP
jgi:hypothetical protein